MKQTAVRFLKEQIENNITLKNSHDVIVILLTKSTLNDYFDKAKEMEEQQKKAAQVEILSLLQAELDGNKTEENNLWYKVNKLKQTI